MTEVFPDKEISVLLLLHENKSQMTAQCNYLSTYNACLKKPMKVADLNGPHEN